jgi:DNA polymerase bacteriophage-type
MECHLDFETRSMVEISGQQGVGLYNYANHPSTEVLMLGWAVDNGEVELWEPHRDPMPEYLRQLLSDPAVTIVAFNTAFERYILQFKLGITIPVERFQDPQASARYLSLPASLDDVGMVLGLPAELQKDKRGDQLITLFSRPKKRTKKEIKLGLPEVYFNDWNSHPVEWNEFCNYCKQDVRAEREVQRRETLLGVFPLPDLERRIWLLDQRINDRGMPVDRDFVQKAFNIADRNKQEKLLAQNQLTGLDNANSTTQLLPWVAERGYPLNNLRKQNVELILKSGAIADEDGVIPEEMTDECRKVLEHRVEAASTSYKKLKAILRNMSDDNTLKNQFIYMGSPRCGRWSGNAVQLHNMARPDGVFEDMTTVVSARNFISLEDYQSLMTKFKKDPKKLRPVEDPLFSPLLVVKNVLRTVFVAPEGKRFNVCDLNAIETRVAAWVAQCKPLLDVFAQKRDPYLDFANKMYGVPYEKLAADLKSKDPAIKAAAKLMRQIAKPGVLGAVYRLGAGGWGRDKNGDRIKTGLWGYAEGMGVDMTLEQAKQVVKIFREAYKEIVDTWTTLENAVKDVLQGTQTIRYVGPDNLIKIDKLTVGGRDPILRIHLPSGRKLHYLDAAMRMTEMPWMRKFIGEDGKEYEVPDQRLSFTYYGKDQSTDQWVMIKSHGGKIFENIVQAIARDVLADKLLRFEDKGLIVVGHVHDEGICLTDDNPFAPGVLEMEQIMNEPVLWALTLPLGSDGFEDHFYHK